MCGSYVICEYLELGICQAIQIANIARSCDILNPVLLQGYQPPAYVNSDSFKLFNLLDPGVPTTYNGKHCKIQVFSFP